MKHNEIIQWLKAEDAQKLQELWDAADRVRLENVGDEVHLRGLVEISNYCRRRCGYCGLRADHAEIGRYRMSVDEILECAHQAVEFGYGTIVMQAGEDPALSGEWISDLISRIKADTPLAITLSLGERSESELAAWRDAGADRYLLRFETSNRELFDHIHPPLSEGRCDRIEMLAMLRKLGYEIGSGVMIGIPGQSWDDLARDVELFGQLDLDMIGVGPFIPHPATPLGHDVEWQIPADQQVPATEEMTYKVVALARLICPQANIPSTSALATLNIAQGRELGLSRGANVVMPNLTPVQYREMYEIYPSKACIRETARQCHGCMRNRILSIGRRIGTGRGDSPNYRSNHAAECS